MNNEKNAEFLESEYGSKVDERGKANSDIIAQAKAKTEQENLDRAVAEAQRNIAKTDYLKEKTLLENRATKAKANAKNAYTKAICEISDKYSNGEIDTTEQNKLICEADKDLRKANDEAENKLSVELSKLRDANPAGYRAAEW